MRVTPQKLRARERQRNAGNYDGIDEPGIRKSGACVARYLPLYYITWFVAVVVVMTLYFTRSSAPSPLIFIFPATTFVAPLFFVFFCCNQHSDQPTSAETQLIHTSPSTAISNLHPQEITLDVHPWRVYNHAELAAATQNFDEANILGAGGEATVFKGIESSSGDETQARKVAVKRIYHVTSDPDELARANAQFKREVQALSHASHRNVVEFYGYCIHGRERFLVYEFVLNGSLHDWLFAPKYRDALTWERRLAIAQDAARGLDYLHNQSNINLIHLDIKPQNILLDENFNAKVADFGLSKLIRRDQTRLPGTIVGGTLGYLPPELNMIVEGGENIITKKADVYSFGIVLLQLVSGRAINDAATMSLNSAMSLLPGLTFWDAAFFLVRTQQFHKLLDTSLEASGNSSVGMTMAEIGVTCLEINPYDRPDMRHVSDLLEGIQP